MLRLVTRERASPRRMELLAGEPAFGQGFTASHYLTLDTCRYVLAEDRPAHLPATYRDLAEVIRLSSPTETGLCLFAGSESVLAVLPPFPVESDESLGGFAPGPLLRLLNRDHTVLVILIRLGRYAVGVLDGDRLVAAKSGTRYVKSRHRAGGSSQRRFERSRQRLMREFFDEVCRVARDLLGGAEARREVEFVIFGGERGTVGGFLERCDLARPHGPRRLSRLLEVDRPGRRALEGMHRQVRLSTLLLLEDDRGSLRG